MKKSIVLIGLLVFSLASCASSANMAGSDNSAGAGGSAMALAAVTTLESSKIGIIGAMEIEVEHLRETMEITNKIEEGGITFYQGTLYDTPVVLAQSGIGKVSAGACAQLMITLFNVEYLINSGVAGGMSAYTQQGDIVISTDAVQHDFDTTVFGDPLGEVAGLGVTFFSADSYLIEVAEIASNQRQFDGISFYQGRVASGDQFIAGGEKAEVIQSTFAPLAVEMEGAAIAQIAYINKVPYVIIRAISDSATGGAVMEYEEFLPFAAANASNLIKLMVMEIGEE